MCLLEDEFVAYIQAKAISIGLIESTVYCQLASLISRVLDQTH